MFHRLGAGGKLPFGGPLESGLDIVPSDGAGAGLIGRFITFWVVLLEVRAGYRGRGGAGAEAGILGTCDLASTEALFAGGDGSRSFSLMVADGGAGARYDVRLLCSSMLTAHASRSTGVRFAAWRKASCSYIILLVVNMDGGR